MDDRIMNAKQQEKEAKAALKRAKADARNEKKRRSRLVRKASGLSVADLERIAKLKRAGLWDPTVERIPAPGDAVAEHGEERRDLRSAAPSGSDSEAGGAAGGPSSETPGKASASTPSTATPGNVDAAASDVEMA